MPFKSEAQRRLMYAAAAGKSDKVSAEDAQSFIAHSRGETPRKKRKLKVKRKKHS